MNDTEESIVRWGARFVSFLLMAGGILGILPCDFILTYTEIPWDQRKAAIENWRQVQDTLRQMQRLSRHVLFSTVPHPPRRKRLGKKVLDLI